MTVAKRFCTDFEWGCEIKKARTTELNYLPIPIKVGNISHLSAKAVGAYFVLQKIPLISHCV